MTREGTERIAWIAGGAGLVASVVGWIVDPAAFAFAWLSALILAIGWPLGSIALVYVHAITGGRWGWAIRPQLIFGVTTLAVILPAIIPIPFLAGALYPWTHSETAAGLLNTWYLNRPFFYGRGILYGIVWLAIGAVTLLAVRRAEPQPLLYRLAAPCLILLALTITFAAIDSTLSLEPEFKSSAYGMIVCAEGVLFALALATFGALMSRMIGPKEREDLGKLMLALTIFWAYLDFMQVLIVWNSDLPGEAGWYVHRIQHGWAWIAGLIALLHFFLPFFVLLWPQMQRSRRALLTMALALIVAEVPRAWWLVLPSSPKGFTWIEIPALLAVAGLAFGLALRAPRFIRIPQTALRPHG
jgi:hypothetical protein